MTNKNIKLDPKTIVENTGNELLSILYWFLSSIWAPITLPWIVYHIINTLRLKYRRTNLNGKVVLITGASSGVGEALAHVFYSSGCKVVLAARRKDELERVKNDLLATHQTIPTHVPVTLTLDLSDINSIPEHVDSVFRIHNQIDILVNNAGISSRGDILSTELNVYEKLMLVNFFGQVALTKAVLPSMIERRSGHILVVNSIQGLIGIPFRSAYAASKHASGAFFDSLRAEVADHNINVTVAYPGYIKTKLSLNALTGTGSLYGKMDDTTAKGYSSEYVAEQIIKAVIEKKDEIITAQFTHKIAICLRRLMPSIYFWIMNKRARKEKLQSDT